MGTVFLAFTSGPCFEFDQLVLYTSNVIINCTIRVDASIYRIGKEWRGTFTGRQNLLDLTFKNTVAFSINGHVL